MPASLKHSRIFHLLALITVPAAMILVWWGATVTTNDVGLSVPDWPLAYGKVNPDGWTQVPALLQEHGHRWAGMIVGLLVLSQYTFQLVRHRGGLIEFVAMATCSIGFLYLVWSGALGLASLVGVMGFFWLTLAWYSQRWKPLRGLTTLALLLVVLQASLGGLRVLKMSDPYGIVHGCLGQLFFCLLLLIAYLSSSTWRHGRLILTGKDRSAALSLSALLFVLVFGQLIVGAILRHTQRVHLAASDILTTNGHWMPPTSAPDLFTLFLHKYYGFTLGVIVIVVAVKAQKWVGAAPVIRWIPPLLMVMPMVQVTLGIFVVIAGKSFWVTNFHVFNGLGILSLTFILMVSCWGSVRTIGMIASTEASPAGNSDAPV